MADKIKGITVQIGGDTGPLSKALSGVNKEIKTTQTQLKEVEKLLKMDPKNVDLLKEKQRLLGEQIKSTKKEITALKQAHEQAAQMLASGEIGQEQYDALGKKIEKAEGKLKSLEGKSKEVSDSMPGQAKKIADGFKDVGDKLDAAAKKLAPFSALAGAGLVAGVKAASDWESAFTGVKKTVDATEEEYADLASGIQEMATRTSSSAEDIAAVAEAAGQLGVSKDDLLGFVETMINLGDTTNVSADEAATSLAKFTNITGSSQKDISKLGSAVVALGNNFATDERSIIAMSQRLASAGTIAGLSETDILGLAAAMSSVGIEAEAGGTAMSQTLTGIEKAISGASKDGGKKLKTLARVAGMSADQFATTWQNEPIEAVQAFIGGLANLEEEGESSTAVLDELGMSGIRQSNMLKSLSLASGTLSSAVATSSKAYETNTALTEEAALRYSTFESQVSQTKESLKQVAIAIGEEVIPFVKDLLGYVKDAVDWFKSLDDTQKKLIVTIAGVVAAAAPVLKVLGSVSKGISSVITGVSGVVTALGAAAAPLAGIVATAGLLITAIVSINDHYDEIYEKASELTEAQKELKEKVEGEAEAWGEVKTSREVAAGQVKELSKKEKELWEKLDQVVDANGKIKKGHEDEAEIIMGELTDAYNHEFKLIEGRIENYGELKNSIDEVIKKHEAEALLQADEENYSKALNERKQTEKNLRQATKDRLDQEKKIKDLEEKLTQVQEEGNKVTRAAYDDRGTTAQATKDYEDRVKALEIELAGERDQLTKLQETEKTAKENLQDLNAVVDTHQDLVKAVATGEIPKMEEAMYNLENTFITVEHGTKESLERQTRNYLDEYRAQRDIVKDTGDEEVRAASYATAELVRRSIENLKELDPQLAAEMQKELDTINRQSMAWNRGGKDNANAYASGVNGGLKNVDVEAKIKAALDLKNKAAVWGKDLAVSYGRSISANASIAKSAASGMAKDIKKVLGFSEPEEGPLSDFHTYAPDMMKLFAQGINDSQWQVIQAAQGVAAGLKASLEDTTLTARLDQSSIPVASGISLNISNFNNYSAQDIRQLTNEIMETAASFAARRGAAFA